MKAGQGLPEFVRELVDETLASGKHDDFRIIASRAESGDYVQWIPGPSGGGALVEIADPEANEVPPRPLSSTQRACVERLGFQKGDPNFQGVFHPDASSSEIAQVITSALEGVFRLTEPEQVHVITPETDRVSDPV